MTPAERFATPVQGYSHTVPVRVVSAGLVVLLIVWGGRALMSESADLGWQVLVLLAAALAMVLWQGWYMLFGRTIIDAQGIRQEGVSDKRISWEEISRLRLVRLPLSARLLVAGQRGPVRAFHAGTPELIAAFAEIEARYASHG